MRQMCRVVIAIALVTAALRGPALGGHNYLAKLAVHVKAHGTSCADGLPTFTTCRLDRRG